jgi:hypothetical protein
LLAGLAEPGATDGAATAAIGGVDVGTAVTMEPEAAVTVELDAAVTVEPEAAVTA